MSVYACGCVVINSEGLSPAPPLKGRGVSLQKYFLLGKDLGEAVKK